MNLLWRFTNKLDFEDYDDFKENFKLVVPEQFDFARDIVDEYAAVRPHKLALLYLNDEGEEQSFSFSKVSRLSKQAAGYLKSLGIKKGDRVMLMLRRRWEYWIIAVALHRIGAILIPTSIQMTAKDITYRITSAEVKMVITMDDSYTIDQIEKALPDCPTIQHKAICGEAREGWLNFNREFPEAEPFDYDETLTNDDWMLFYFTSGTTGMPKIVAHDRRYPLGQIVTAKYMQCCEDKKLHFTMSDSGWAKFGWGCIYGQWICGSAIFGYDPVRFDPQNFISAVKNHKPATVCVPPTIYRFLLQHGFTAEDFASVNHFATAGEPLSGDLNMQFEQITGHGIYEGFGQSEGAVLVCTFHPYLVPKPGSMGRPNPIYDIVIVDKEGKPVAKGEHGEIVVRNLGEITPPTLVRGYYKDGKFERGYDDIYHTGDIAYEDEDGYFWFVGRNDDIIKSSGYRIGPFEIESVLGSHEAVKEVAITGEPDPVRGQIVSASIVLKPGYEPDENLTKELQKYVKEQTAPYKYPRKVHYVQELPKTFSGKISRVRIREDKEKN